MIFSKLTLNKENLSQLNFVFYSKLYNNEQNPVQTKLMSLHLKTL